MSRTDLNARWAKAQQVAALISGASTKVDELLRLARQSDAVFDPQSAFGKQAREWFVRKYYFELERGDRPHLVPFEAAKRILWGMGYLACVDWKEMYFQNEVFAQLDRNLKALGLPLISDDEYDDTKRALLSSQDPDRILVVLAGMNHIVKVRGKRLLWLSDGCDTSQFAVVDPGVYGELNGKDVDERNCFLEPSELAQLRNQNA